MVIKSEVGGECIEEIRIEVGREILRLALVCPGFFGLALSAPLGLSSGCVDGNGVRYRRLICGAMEVIEETESPRHCRGVDFFPLVAL